MCQHCHRTPCHSTCVTQLQYVSCPPFPPAAGATGPQGPAGPQGPIGPPGIDNNGLLFQNGNIPEFDMSYTLSANRFGSIEGQKVSLKAVLDISALSSVAFTINGNDLSTLTTTVGGSALNPVVFTAEIQLIRTPTPATFGALVTQILVENGEISTANTIIVNTMTAATFLNAGYSAFEFAILQTPASNEVFSSPMIFSINTAGVNRVLDFEVKIESLIP